MVIWGAKKNGRLVGEREDLTKRMEVESKEYMKLLAKKNTKINKLLAGKNSQWVIG